MLYNVRKHVPQAEIICICPWPENVTLHYDISTYSFQSPLIPTTADEACSHLKGHARSKQI